MKNLLNKIIKQITIKRIVVLILLLSLAGNAYWLGMNWLKNERGRFYNAGVLKVFLTTLETGIINYTFPEVKNEEGEIMIEKGKKIQLIIPSQCPKPEIKVEE